MTFSLAGFLKDGKLDAKLYTDKDSVGPFAICMAHLCSSILNDC